MSSGAMWWVKSEWIGKPSAPPGVTLTFGPNGLTFSGALIAPPLVFPGGTYLGPWRVELRMHYVLDPPRMPGTGEPFISLPKLTFTGGLGLRGGIDQENGSALFSVSLTQSLRPGGVEVASSNAEWIVGYVYGQNVLVGKNVLTAGQRDYGALFFNLDRTQTLVVTLVTSFFFSVGMGGVIAFAPGTGFTVGAPPWLIHSLD